MNLVEKELQYCDTSPSHFDDTYPESLSPYMSLQEFRHSIRKLNKVIQQTRFTSFIKVYFPFLTLTIVTCIIISMLFWTGSVTSLQFGVGIGVSIVAPIPFAVLLQLMMVRRARRLFQIRLKNATIDLSNAYRYRGIKWELIATEDPNTMENQSDLNRTQQLKVIVRTQTPKDDELKPPPVSLPQAVKFVKILQNWKKLEEN